MGRVHRVLEQLDDEPVAVGATSGVLLRVRVLTEPGRGCRPGVEHPALDRRRPERVAGLAAGLAGGAAIILVRAPPVVKRAGLGVAAVGVHNHVPVWLRVHRSILLFGGGWLGYQVPPAGPAAADNRERGVRGSS